MLFLFLNCLRDRSSLAISHFCEQKTGLPSSWVFSHQPTIILFLLRLLSRKKEAVACHWYGKKRASQLLGCLGSVDTFSVICGVQKEAKDYCNWTVRSPAAGSACGAAQQSGITVSCLHPHETTPRGNIQDFRSSGSGWRYQELRPQNRACEGDFVTNQLNLRNNFLTITERTANSRIIWLEAWN